MGNNRRLMTLGDLGPIITGKTPSTKVPGHFGGTIPFVTPRDMDGRRTIKRTERYLTEKGAKAVANAIIPPGSIMVSCIGSDMGKVAIAGRQCVTNQQINSIIVSAENIAEYVYYDLSRRKHELRLMASGSAQPILNKGHFSQVKIEMPEPVKQRAIAHVLGSLDDKIELNRQMNRTLEKMAQAIFKSWFIDFDPVRAKAEGRDPGLPKEIADLFPDSFEDSELGPIPKGWKIGTISDLAKVTSGKRPHKRSKEKTGEFTIPLYGGGGIMAYVPVPMISTPFLLTGRVGTLGKVFRITEECWPSDNTLLLFPNNKSCLEFLYFTLQRIDFDSLNRGSTQPLVTQTDLKNQRIVIPKENILIFYWQNAHPMFEKIDKNIAESRALASLRDTLLPKLISGELRVPDTEQLVEGMV